MNKPIQVCVELRKQFINNFIFPTLASAAVFNNNNNNNNNNHRNKIKCQIYFND